jgi:hypothetical protein
VNRIIAAGYPYEIAGLVFYVFFLFMVRKQSGARYSGRTRILTIVAAIALVGVVPFHYGGNASANVLLLVLGLGALGSAFIDARVGGSG